VCEASPGPRCASETHESWCEAVERYDERFGVSSTPVNPIASASAYWDTSPDDTRPARVGDDSAGWQALEAARSAKREAKLELIGATAIEPLDGPRYARAHAAVVAANMERHSRAQHADVLAAQSRAQVSLEDALDEERDSFDDLGVARTSLRRANEGARRAARARTPVTGGVREREAALDAQERVLSRIEDLYIEEGLDPEAARRYRDISFVQGGSDGTLDPTSQRSVMPNMPEVHVALGTPDEAATQRASRATSGDGAFLDAQLEFRRAREDLDVADEDNALAAQARDTIERNEANARAMTMAERAHRAEERYVNAGRALDDATALVAKYKAVLDPNQD
jgi:hypothetical protein